MRFITLLILLLIPSFSFGMSKDERIKALEVKVELLMPTVLAKDSYDVHGVKKQGIKNPYHHKKGFHFESQDGKFSTNLQFRAQMRFSKPFTSDPRTSGSFSPAESNNFELRRVRIKIGGHGYKYVKYYFEVDLQPSRSVGGTGTDSSARVIDWRIDVQPYEWLGFRVGQWKINYNRERVDSSGRQQFVERSIVNRIFTIDRQVGAMIKGLLNKGTAGDMRYYAGIFNGEGRAVNNSGKDLMKMVRLQWNPLGRDLKWRQSDVSRHEKPTLSIAGAWAGNRGNCTRWSSSGCGNLDGFAVGANENQFKINQAVAEVAYKHQGLSIQSEYHWKNVADDNTGLEHDYEGAYAQAGYFFNEINKSIPEELELAFRYAFVDEPDSTGNMLLQNTRREYTVGANWFIAGHGNKVTLDYSHLTLDDASSNRGFEDDRVRVQWDISF
ncbi:MAG: phosphate-selective porin OprO/OprP [Nitrospinales bacterium]|jgi:phosphate-selective porin OprO/OprP